MTTTLIKRYNIICAELPQLAGQYAMFLAAAQVVADKNPTDENAFDAQPAERDEIRERADKGRKALGW